MNLAAALIYWVIVALWLTILGTIIFFYVRNPHTFGTTRLLLAVLAVDAFRKHPGEHLLRPLLWQRVRSSAVATRSRDGPSGAADPAEVPERRGRERCALPAAVAMAAARRHRAQSGGAACQRSGNVGRRGFLDRRLQPASFRDARTRRIGPLPTLHASAERDDDRHRPLQDRKRPIRPCGGRPRAQKRRRFVPRG